MDEPTESLKVLVVQQDKKERNRVVEALRRDGDELATAKIAAVGCGREGLALDLTEFDLIITGYRLSDMAGPEFLKKVKAQTDVPVIFVTGEKRSSLAIDAIRRGAQDYVVKAGDYLAAIPVVARKNLDQYRLRQENQRLRGEMEQMLIQLQVKNSQLEESLDKVEQMAATDFLTGLPNRRNLNEALSSHYDQAVRYNFDLTCCMADLDGLKRVNDSCGHQTGDDILVLAADVIRGCLRSSDVASRYGGDEFALLLLHASAPEARKIAARIRAELERATGQHEKLSTPLTISMGIASLREDKPYNSEDMIAMADKAMYEAKRLGKNRIVSYCEIAVQSPQK